MNNRIIIQKLRRLHTLLVLGKRSNNLALAIRRALDNICKWEQNVDVIVARTPVRQLFAGYGPKFIKLFDELIRTGDIAMIRQLQPEFDPFFCYLCEIPGIGETMARRMFFDRSICSMDDLRIAYTNDILRRIPAFGEARLQTIEKVLWNSQSGNALELDWDESDIVKDIANTDIAVRYAPLTSDTNSGQLDLFSENPQNWLPRAVPNDVHSEEHKLEEPDIENLVSPAEKTSSDMRYPREFIESNSILFRASRVPETSENVDNSDERSESNAAVDEALASLHLDPEESELPPDFANISTDVQNNDSSESVEEAESKVVFVDGILDGGNSVSDPDPAVDAQLHAFIERDLALWNRRSEHCLAEVIHANRIETQSLTAHFIQADIIMVSSMSIQNDIAPVPPAIDGNSKNIQHEIVTDSLTCDSLQADSVHARIIVVHTLTAQYVEARCIRPYK